MPETEAAKPENFETSLKRLEDIVKKMEGGQLTLDQMLRAFEEGSRLVKVCNTRLTEVERRIELLVKKDGQVESAPFGDADTGAEGDSHEIRR